MKAQLWEQSLLPQSLKQRILEEMQLQWPAGFSGDLLGRDWIHPEDALPRTLVLCDDLDLPCAFCSIMHKNLEVLGQNYTVNGLSGVLVFARARGRGYGDFLLREASQILAAESVDLSVFSCAEDLVPFYRRYGFEICDLRLWLGDSSNPSQDLEPFMVKAYTERARALLKAIQGKDLYFGPYGW